MIENLVINISAVKAIFCDYYREAAAKLLYAIEKDGYSLAGVENMYVTRGGKEREKKEFPCVINLLADAMNSKDSKMITPFEDAQMHTVFSVTEIQELIQKPACAYYRMIQVSENIFLWQYIGENGVTTTPRLFEESIDDNGRNVFHELLPLHVNIVGSDGVQVESYMTCVSQYDILSMYGVSKPGEYLLEDPGLEVLQDWILSFRDVFSNKLSYSQKKGLVRDTCKFIKTGDFKFLLEETLEHVWAEPIRKGVDFYYCTHSTLKKKKDYSVGPIIVTLEVENKLSRFGEAAAVLERPRYVGWFKTLQDAVNFVVFEIENNPTYKDKEEVIKDILPDGDIVMTINSTLKLTYHFEVVQK